MKLASKQLWGPYAMLVREVAALSKEVGNHDYLDAPEIIEDICHVLTVCTILICWNDSRNQLRLVLSNFSLQSPKSIIWE